MAKYVITSIPQKKFPTGGTVSQRWEQITGTPWSEAKAKGLTTGSFEDNIALLKKLNSGDFNLSNDVSKNVSISDPTPRPAQSIDPSTLSKIKGAQTFNQAFTIARSALGSNQIFEWNGRKYGTNLKGETFNPSTEVLAAAGMNTPKVKERLQKENSQLNSPFISKSTVKLEEDPYQDWEEIKKKNEELNKKSNADKIINYKKKAKDGKNFVIVDKQKGLLHIYDPTGTQLFSSAIDLGAQSSDAQTVTKYRDLNNDGKISQNEMKPSNVDWSAGNLSTGAGKFYISNIDKTGYQGLPILNMMNESQYENYLKTGKVENVSTSFHKGYIKDDKSRVSNGCIRCSKTTLDNLSKYLQNSSEVYILPEDKGNEFVYENGKLNFRVNPQYDYNTYNDQTGKTQKGQGVNRTQTTLNYQPIKLKFDEDKFRDEIFTAMDFDDEAELSNTKKYINALQDNKQSVMKAAKINGDVYNEIAKIAFGIYGTESGYGDTHSGITNFGRAINKWADPTNASSPDYESKYETYGATENYRSVGFTQVRWNYLNEDEKKALKEVGITSNSDFMDPEKAAIGTAVVLGVRYNQQLTSDQKKDLWTYLPTKWNTRDNYADRVKNNARFVSVYQYTGSDKPKTSTSKTTTKSIKTHTPIYGSTISGRDQYHPKLNPSPASSTYVKPFTSYNEFKKVDFAKAVQQKKPIVTNQPYNWYNTIYQPIIPSMYNNNMKKLPFKEMGGFVEVDIPDDAVQDYVNRGYIVEEVPQYPDGGIFRRRRQSRDYTPWSGVNPEIVQPGEDPFALPTYPSGPAPEFALPDYQSMFPGWSEEEINNYYTEKEAYDARMARKNAYAPAELTFKDLARPKASFVLAEDMTEDFKKKLKDLGFYAKKTSTGDYEVFSNKDIADLIYQRGITPTELATEFDLGKASELKAYFKPVYDNASMIHAKRNKQKIDALIEDGYTKDQAINQLVKQGEGTKSGLTNLYGSYTEAAYNKNKAQADALLSMGVKDIDKLTDYQKQMYLNIKNFADTEYEKQVGTANDAVSAWGNWAIQPSESTAVRNKAGYTDPTTGEYVQADNRTAYEKNEDAKFKAQEALARYNATTAAQAGAAKAIIGSENLTDEQRKQFLENPDEFNKIYQEYVNWSNAPRGEQTFVSNFTDPYVRIYPGQLKSEFNINPEGAQWTPGTYEERRTIDGAIQPVYPEMLFMGPGAGLLGGGFRALSRALEYAPISAAPWLTAGNALNAYMGYETVKPGGLISQSIEGFKEDDAWKGWGNAAMSGLNLLPFVGPTAKSLEYLNALGKVDDAAAMEGVTQAGFGSWLKPTPGASSVVDDITLKNLKANNYQGASDDVLTKILEKGRSESTKGFWNSTITPDEQLILKANEARAKELSAAMGPVTAAPKTPATGFVGKAKEKIVGAGTKVGETVAAPAQNWWAKTKSHFGNSNWLEAMYPLQISKSTTGAKTTTEAATAAVQTTGKYQSMDEIAQSMYGVNFDDLASSLAKAQVEKAFKAQPLPSGASTSAQGLGSTTTNVSDDIILKNKISQQKYGQDYDQVSSWAQTAVDKEFQAAKTLQQDAAATTQTQNAASSNINATGTQQGGVQFTTPPRFEHARVGESLQGLYQRGKYWDEAGAKGEDLLNSDMINFHGTYGGRPIVEVKMPDGSSEFFYKSTGWAGKEANKGVLGFGKKTTEGAWQPFGGFADTPSTKNWFIKDAGYQNYYGSNTFKGMAENLDNALLKKFGMKNTKELDNAINFQNRFGKIDSYTPMGLGIVGTAGAMGDDENSNLMLATLPLAFMSRGKLNLAPDKLKYLKVATAAANEAAPLKAASVLNADANTIKSFIDGPAFNLTSKETKGAFNEGVFNIKNEPDYIAKMENAIGVGSSRGMPNYQNVNMAEAMQNISGSTFGKVHHQIESANVPGRRALILNRVEGTPYDQLLMDDFLNLSDDAIVGFHDDLQTLKRNNLGFDFTGNNYMFDRNTNQFKLFDIDPHTDIFDPAKVGTFDFFQTQVYGGGNPLLYGSKQAGYNLQNALRQRLLRDVELKMGQAGMTDTDIMGIKNVYDQRLQYLLKGLNYEKDGGSIEMDIDPEMLDQLIAAGYNVEQV